MARKLTSEQIEKIVKAAEDGFTAKEIAELAGCSERSVHSVVREKNLKLQGKRGRKPKTPEETAREKKRVQWGCITYDCDYTEWVEDEWATPGDEGFCPKCGIELAPMSVVPYMKVNTWYCVMCEQPSKEWNEGICPKCLEKEEFGILMEPHKYWRFRTMKLRGELGHWDPPVHYYRQLEAKRNRSRE